jgi:hypothetical protein
VISGLSAEAVGAVARRPDLWPTALAAGRSLVPSGWWRRRPHLPLPDPDWIRFRLETAYGGDGTNPIRGADLVAWLEWKKLSP